MPDLFTAPPADRCGVIELRQYTMRPGRRDELIELFDRAFVEAQEAVGIRVIGQFRDLDDPHRFTWLRGYADMAARGQALPAFYDGPVWAAHRAAANATMLDSSDVLLLRPAWEGAALPPGERAVPGAAVVPPGLLAAWVLPLEGDPAPELIDFCRRQLLPSVNAAGGQAIGCYVSERTPNNFPRHPVRESDSVLVAFALFSDSGALQAFVQGRPGARELQPALAGWLAAAPRLLRLRPTARSALHG